MRLVGEALDRRMDLVLHQIGTFFMAQSPVHRAAEQVARLLEEMKVAYAISGALALGLYGFVRATEDVDVLLTPEGLRRFKEEWLGRGYVNLRPGGKAVRDTVHAVKIDFLLTGEYPGDGKPKPVAFPDPDDAAAAGERYRVLAIEKLVELKLASGMTAPHRLHDLADVLRLVQVAGLARDFASALDPYVRDEYDELWLAAQHDDDE